MNILSTIKNLVVKDNLKWENWKRDYYCDNFGKETGWVPTPRIDYVKAKWRHYMDGQYPVTHYSTNHSESGKPEYTRLICDWNQNWLKEHPDKKAIGNFPPPETLKECVITRGLWTLDQMLFKPGRIKILARFNTGKGTWPALWLRNISTPDSTKDYYEIDITENFVNNPYFEQTVHYPDSMDGKKKPIKGYSIKKSGWNEFVCEYDKEHVKIWVNGHLSLDTKMELPEEWYLIMSMQYGWEKWDLSQLPLWMDIKSVEHFNKI